MDELLHAYNQWGRIVKTQERSSLLQEIRDYSYKHGDANLAVETIYLVLSNSNGELYVVRRGDKQENPNRFDKTVGGHVHVGETAFSTLYREAREEIGVQVILVDLFGYPQAAYAIDTTQFAVVRPINYHPWMKSIRYVKDGEPWVKRHKVTIFAGRYDGPVQFIDGEAVDLQLIHRDKLPDRIKKSPDQFTYDLEVLLRNYSVFF
jgi:8-oxo-dGTP pyrophosphatase MutT (NUDIX family)